MAFFDAFGVDVFKLAFQIVNFLILLFLLNRFLFKPVLRRIDERNAQLSQGLEDAAAAARDRELARAEREAALAEARKESEALVARAAKTAEATSAEILATARASADQLTERAREEIAAEKERALAEIRGEVADLALDAAGKLVGSEMDSPTQRRLVEQFLAENRN
jgi:F-type H+-transporting ATPase subunit b